MNNDPILPIKFILGETEKELPPERKKLFLELKEFVGKAKVHIVSPGHVESKIRKLEIPFADYPNSQLDKMWLDLAASLPKPEEAFPTIDLVVGGQRFKNVYPVSFETPCDPPSTEGQKVSVNFNFSSQVLEDPE